jgi:DNA-binding GntR family transcriptional regulator
MYYGFCPDACCMPVDRPRPPVGGSAALLKTGGSPDGPQRLGSATSHTRSDPHSASLPIELRMMSKNKAPLKPVSLRHRIVEIIRQAITSGELNPGDRIVELRLAKELGVGNTAVREALFELERTGLVTRIPNKGSFITKTTFEDAQQIFRVRKELEALAVELAVEHMSAPYLDMLQGLVDAMRTAAETNDFERFYENDLQFHRTLWQLSQNRYLAGSLETLVAPLFAFFLIRTRLDYRIDLLGSAERHHQLLDSIRNRRQVRDSMMASLGSSESFWEQVGRTPPIPPPGNQRG